MKKNKNKKKDIILFFLIITITGLLYLWFHLEIINLSYENQILILDKNKLSEQNKKLQIKYAETYSPINIKKLANKKLGLIKPKEKQYRYIK